MLDGTLESGLDIHFTDNANKIHRVMVPVQSSYGPNQVQITPGISLSSEEINNILAGTIPDGSDAHILYFPPGRTPMVCKKYGDKFPDLELAPGNYKIINAFDFSIRKL